MKQTAFSSIPDHHAPSEVVKFDLVRRARRWDVRDLGPELQLLIVLFSLGAVMSVPTDEPFGIGLSLFITFFLFLGFIFWAPVEWLSKTVVVGTLIVHADGLESAQNNTIEKIRFQDIAKARFIHDHIKGARFHMKDIEHTGIAHLVLNLRSGKELTYTLLIHRWEQVPQVQEMLRSLYRQRVDLQEFMGRQKLRTILFEQGRSFDEVQALKKELGIDHFA